MRWILLCTLLIAGLAAAGSLTPAQAGARTNYCQYGTRSSLFLVDRTTPYDEIDRRIIIDSIGAVVEGMSAGDRIVVATIGRHYSVSERVIDECKPGCPANANPFGAILSGCRAMIAMRDDQLFRAHLRAAIRPLLQIIEEAPNSDITGTIAQWTRRPPGGRAFTNIYIFSDMLENSQALAWREFRDIDESAAMAVVERYGLSPSVHDAEVRIVGFGRLHDLGRSVLPADLDLKLRTFWLHYFEAGGARAVTFEGEITR